MSGLLSIVTSQQFRTATTEAPAAVASVVISGASTVVVGGTIQLTATPKDAAGNPLVDRVITWSSSDPANCPVNGTGLVNPALAGVYIITALCEGVSSTKGVSATSPVGVGSLVTFTSPSWEALAGPLPTMGPGYNVVQESDLASVDTSENPSPWYDYNLKYVGLPFGEALPKKPFHDLSGTVSATNGSLVMTGTGTSFLAEIGSGNRITLDDGTGTWPASSTYGVVASVESDTHLTLRAVWAGPDRVGVMASTLRPVTTGNVQINYWKGFGIYYDYPYVAYQRYCQLRESNPVEAVRWLQIASDTAEVWWGTDSPYGPQSGFGGLGGNMNARESACGGLICRALQEDDEAGVPGTSRKWDWLYRYVTAQWALWVYNRRTYDNLYFGVREPGYSLLYLAWLARLLPDSYPTSDGLSTVTDGATKRATMLAQLIEVTVGTGVDIPNSYYRRIQTVPTSAVGPVYQVAGAWVWNDDPPYDRFGYFNEPWHTGLLLEGMVALHRLLLDTGGHDAEAAELGAMILDAVDGTHALGNIPTGSLIMKTPGVSLDGTTKYRTWAYAVNNDQMPPNDLAELAGTVTLIPGSATVAGTGTQLVTDGLVVGERIRFYRPLTGTVSLSGAGTASFVSIINGQTTITDSEGAWTQDHVGAELMIKNQSTGVVLQTTTIAAVLSATSIEVADTISVSAATNYSISWTGTSAVSGAGTVFLSELVPGEIIVARGRTSSRTWGTVYLRVESIESDTHLTLSCPTNRLTDTGLSAWREVFNHLPGTVSATKGSAVLTGTGTAFLSQFDAAGTPVKPRYIWLNTVEDAGSGQHAFAWRRHSILSVDSDTQITLTAAFAQITRTDLRYANTPGGDYVVGPLTETGITLLSPIVDTAPLSAAVGGGGWKIHRKWQGGPLYLTGGSDTNAIRDTRQNLPTAIHTFGYAYKLSGDTKYLAWGDEMLESAFGKGHGVNADPYYCLADYVTPNDGQRGKEFDQSYRSSGHYLAWRNGA